MTQLRSFIVVRSSFIGFHRWEEAPISVIFLRALHRHLFKVEVTLEVTETNRQLEFFCMQAVLNEIIGVLKNHLQEAKYKLSCEAMAQCIMSQFRGVKDLPCVRVVVSEDGESDGVVELVDL